MPAAPESRASSVPKNADLASGCPFSRATSATLAAGSMPSTGISCGDEVLQQVAVVAGDLDDLVRGREAEPRRSRRRRTLRACSSQLCEYDEK